MTAATAVTPVSDNGYATRPAAATAATAATADTPDLQTDFIRKVRENFIGSSQNSKWPPVDNAAVRKQDIAAFELPNAIAALFDTLERGANFPAGLPGTAIALLRKAVDETDWPNTAEVPERWRAQDRKLFHEFEIGVVTNIMMQAYNRAAPGGTPRDWPPTGP
ncbi:MAG TPA: hypothetical protein VJP84_14680 [Steroidobacteraceae bacterium]|nr:hypothetical protein [Steroidobacteraceae bacterium]